MINNVIFMAHNYFQLDGIPAYPSYFTPVDFILHSWIDLTDIYRFRRERYFITKLAPGKSGMEYYAVGNGSGGIVFRREYWDGKIYNEVKSAISNPVSDFNSVREREVNKYHQFMDKANRREDNLQFIGVEVDDKFGNINVIRKNNLYISASEIYQNYPMIVEYRNDVEQMRLIDLREIVLVEKDGEVEQVLHSQFKLTNWSILTPNEVPERLFDYEYIVGS
jgi:hypothetical protein